MRVTKLKTKSVQAVIQRRRRRRIVVFVIFLCILTGFAGTTLFSIYYNSQAESTKRYNAYIKERDAQYAKELAETKKIKPWYTYRAVCHALGAVDGHDYLNSIDGFYEGYEKGYRLFEMDLLTTSDGVLVGRHEWGSNLSDVHSSGGSTPSYSTFKDTKLEGKYKPTSFSQMLYAMDKYKDFYLITDTKDGSKESVQRTFSKIVAAAKSMGKEEYLDRVVVQIYSENMYSYVKEVYPFKNFIYTTYKQSDDEFYKTAMFCKENGIKGLTCRRSDVNDYRMKTLQEYKIYSYTHTVNERYFAKQYMMLGVYGIYSDLLTADEINYTWFEVNGNEDMTKLLKGIFPPYRKL